MTNTFVDLAGGEPSPEDVIDAGHSGVIGYLCPGAEASFSAETARRFRGAGLDVLLVWRASARRELSGDHGGRQDGELAGQMASARDYPRHCTVYASIGLDASPADLSSIKDYLLGFSSSNGHPVGVFGSARVVEHVLASGAAGHGWQTQAWSGAYVSTRAHLYQRVSHRRPRIAGMSPGGYHENTVLQPDCGAWGVHCSHPASR
ncbi:MAG TPA: glycoside hydrolase domain-containing protein [Kineosporiaceae bacterium]|nr:glycoside hydrolase domain-containing protein [Kineosporiaceae bacterium]